MKSGTARRRPRIFLTWIALALLVLAAPLSSHLGILDALRLLVLVLGLAALLHAFLTRRWGRGLASLVLVLLLASPWSTLGTLPRVGDARALRLVVLPSSNATAIDYALRERADLIFIPDLSDDTRRALAARPEPAWRSAGTPLDALAADYPQWIVNAADGVAIFVAGGIAADDLRLRGNAPDTGATVASLTLLGIDLTLAAAHLARPFPLAPFGRQKAQATALAELLATYPQPVILAGDFNALPWSATARQLSGVIDAHGNAWRGSFPASFPSLARLPLDQVLVGAGLAVGSIITGPDVGSVHLPLSAEILLPPR